MKGTSGILWLVIAALLIPLYLMQACSSKPPSDPGYENYLEKKSKLCNEGGPAGGFVANPC
jgi:hypothetical protein